MPAVLSSESPIKEENLILGEEEAKFQRCSCMLMSEMLTYILCLIYFSHVIISGGSVKADILVLAKVEEHTSKAEATTRLMDGFDTAFKKRLGISAVIVNGKWSTTDNNFFLI